MYLNTVIAIAMVQLTTALQLELYSDYNCTNHETYLDAEPTCSPVSIPLTGSVKLGCKPQDNCTQIIFYVDNCTATEALPQTFACTCGKGLSDIDGKCIPSKFMFGPNGVHWFQSGKTPPQNQYPLASASGTATTLNPLWTGTVQWI